MRNKHTQDKQTVSHIIDKQLQNKADVNITGITAVC